MSDAPTDRLSPEQRAWLLRTTGQPTVKCLDTPAISRAFADTLLQLAAVLEREAALRAELDTERAARNRIARECADKIDRSVDYGRLRYAEDEVESAENVLKLDAGIQMGRGLTVADGIREVVQQRDALAEQMRALTTKETK